MQFSGTSLISVMMNYPANECCWFREDYEKIVAENWKGREKKDQKVVKTVSQEGCNVSNLAEWFYFLFFIF